MKHKYYIFTFISSCFLVLFNLSVHAQCSGITTTWTAGAWSNGVPTINDVAIIDEDYDTSFGGAQISFSACSLTVQVGTLRVNNGQFIEVDTDVIVETGGEIIVETQGSFVQNGNGTSAGSFVLNGTGSSQVNKFTSPLNNWYDYTYWSSPVADADIDIALGFANPERRFYFNANNYLDVAPQDDIDDDGNAWAIATGSGIMEIGRGYAATHTQIGFNAGSSYQYNFFGPLNTGDYNYLLAYDPSNSDHWNLVGNPYPSAIDTDLLFAANPSIKNVVYIWSHFRDPLSTNPGNEVLNFNQSDYLIINTTMPLGNGSDLNGDGAIDILDTPEKKIPSGQAFFVSSSSAGSILFDNSMRISGNNVNDEFYRNSQTSNTANTNKLWINLNSDNGAYSQTGIGYIGGATAGDDGPGYDAKRNESYTNATIIYSLIEGGNETKFAIQGRSLNDLSESEIVRLGFSTNITSPTIYTIKALKFEGLFLNNNNIYLKDNLLNTIHNLKTSDYNFTSEVGEFNDRFEIVFNADVLSTNDNDIKPSQLIISEHSNGNVRIALNHNKLTISNIEILDITGRQIYNFKAKSASDIYDLSNLNKAAYIARVSLSNGQVISKKAIKQN